MEAFKQKVFPQEAPPNCIYIQFVTLLLASAIHVLMRDMSDLAPEHPDKHRIYCILHIKN